MTKGVCSVTPETPLSQVVEVVQEKRISCLVVTENRCPIGIITERDLVRIFHQSLRSNSGETLPARNIMSTPPFTCHEETSFYDALVILQSQKIKHLPVVDSDEILVGILTYSDLSQKYVHILNRQREETAEDRRKLQNDNSKLRAMSFEDPLMEIGNRRAMEVDLIYTHNLSLRHKNPYSIVVVDVDWFKKFNDCYGHTDGDKALKKTAKILNSNIRGSDRIYRYGGEEILILLPHTEDKGALKLAQRLVDKISQRKIPHKESPLKVLTVSCGLASFTPLKDTKETWEDLFKLADKRLYQAKKGGRCRVGSGDSG